MIFDLKFDFAIKHHQQQENRKDNDVVKHYLTHEFYDLHD